MKMPCQLCLICEPRDKVYYEDNEIIVVQTKLLKGHKNRIMAVWKEHIPTKRLHGFEQIQLINTLVDVGTKVFNYTSKFVIMDETHASMPEHAHYVATDLDPNSDDFDQILETRWKEVVDVNG